MIDVDVDKTRKLIKEAIANMPNRDERILAAAQERVIIYKKIRAFQKNEAAQAGEEEILRGWTKYGVWLSDEAAQAAAIIAQRKGYINVEGMVEDWKPFDGVLWF